MICPKNYSANQRVDFYIKPDEEAPLKDVLSKFASKESIEIYKSEPGIDCIYNLENYAHSMIFITWAIEDREIKLLKVDIRHPIEDGCKCKSCKHFIQYAAPNQPDNTFVCFSCVTNPIRAYY
jgi:hypothetical protein